MHIALDAMGGDLGPAEMVAGAVKAVQEYDFDVTLVGDQSLLSGALHALGASAEADKSGRQRLRIVHTTQVVGMDESPFEAVRKKKDSSIYVAFDLLKGGQVDAVVSAGNSGATMAGAIKLAGRLPDISRPGIAGIFPTLKKPLVMMDVGANVDCRPQHLCQFAVMGAAFSKLMFDNERPRIGLLSIGEEGGKGNTLVKGTHELLLQSSLNYIGNVEGRDIFQGDVDVIVCDGFVGNVCLKLSEGLAEAMISMLREEINLNLKAKVGYLLTKSAFKNLKKRIDYAEYGGASLLGIKGSCIVCHGRSSALAIKNALRVAADMVNNKVNDHILALLHEQAILVG